MPDEFPFIKICGVTTPTQAAEISRLGLSAIGINFYAKSPRAVTREQGRHVREAIARDVLAVGVFVNADVPELVATTRLMGLDAIQLHGDEPVAIVSQLRALLPGIKIYRAFRVGSEGLSLVKSHVEQLTALGQHYDAILIDARLEKPAALPPGQQAEVIYGGTGHKAPWELLVGWREVLGDTPLILAGGLNADNVAAAIRAVAPTGVDTASGVETAPGVKDISQSTRFIAHARETFKP